MPLGRRTGGQGYWPCSVTPGPGSFGGVWPTGTRRPMPPPEPCCTPSTAPSEAPPPPPRRRYQTPPRESSEACAAQGQVLVATGGGPERSSSTLPGFRGGVRRRRHLVPLALRAAPGPVLPVDDVRRGGERGRGGRNGPTGRESCGRACCSWRASPSCSPSWRRRPAPSLSLYTPTSPSSTT